jgi:hypothetical protein
MSDNFGEGKMAIGVSSPHERSDMRDSTATAPAILA